MLAVSHGERPRSPWSAASLITFITPCTTGVYRRVRCADHRPKTRTAQRTLHKSARHQRKALENSLCHSSGTPPAPRASQVRSGEPHLEPLVLVEDADHR